MDNEVDLDTVFALAAQPPLPSADLMARILADAVALQPKPRVSCAVPVVQRGWLGRLADILGGGRALAGVTAAAAAGLYLGIAQPTPVLALTSLVSGTTTLDNLDLLPSSTTLWAQE